MCCFLKSVSINFVHEHGVCFSVGYFITRLRFAKKLLFVVLLFSIVVGIIYLQGEINKNYMSIKVQDLGSGKLQIDLDNGHSEALKKIVADYNLKGEQEALSFILSIISEAEGKPIGNGKGNFIPSEKLKKDTLHSNLSP